MSKKGLWTTVLAEVGADGVGAVNFDADGADALAVQVILTGFQGVLQCLGSTADTAPNMANPASLTNIYAPKLMNNLDSGGSVSGSIGITEAAPATYVKEYKINVESTIRFINFKVSSYAAGTVSVVVRKITKD